MADYAVSMAFTAKDGVTDKLTAMGAAAARFGDKAETGFQRAGVAGLSFKKLVGGILTAGFVQRGISMLTQGIRDAWGEYKKFEDVITASGAIFGGIRKGSRAFDELKLAAREVGSTTEYSAVQAAEGLRFMAKAGYEPAFAMKALKSFVDLAAASEEDFAEATSMASDILGAFRLNTGTAEERLRKLKDANDVLVKTVNMSNLNLVDLYETIKFAGPIAVDAGVSLEKFGAIAAFVGGAGIKGTLAGTAMRSALLSLTGQSEKVRKEFHKLGIQMADSTGKMRDPIAIFEDLRVKMAKMGNAKRLAIIGEIFGERAISGVSVSIAGGEKALRKFEQALQDTKGESAKTAEMMRASISKRLDIMKASAIELTFTYIEAFDEKIPDAINSVTAALKKIDVKSITAEVRNLALTAKDLCSAFAPLAPIMASLVISFGAYEAIIAGKALYTGLVKLAGAQGLLNAAMLANPIGMWIAAIGLLAGSMYMLYQRLDDIKEIISWLIDKSIQGTKDIAAAFQKLADSEVFKSLVAGYQMIFNASGKRLLSERKFVPTEEEGAAAEAPTEKYYERGGATKIVAPAPEYMSKVPSPSPFEIGKAPGKAGREAEQTARAAVAQQKAREEREINFYGQLDIKGAPPGSRVTSTTRGAPPIQVGLLGDNL